MKARAFQIAFLFCALATSSVLGQADVEFAKANQEYAQGHFKEAISGYETLVRAGQWSANVFYDLGNAYFRTGDLGRVILNYERALALERHHPEATANLQIARDEARALEMQQSWPERYLQFASSNQYSIAAADAFWVGVFCIVRLIFGRRDRLVDSFALHLRHRDFGGLWTRPRQQRPCAGDCDGPRRASAPCDGRHCEQRPSAAS